MRSRFFVASGFMPDVEAYSDTPLQKKSGGDPTKAGFRFAQQAPPLRVLSEEINEGRHVGLSLQRTQQKSKAEALPYIFFRYDKNRVESSSTPTRLTLTIDEQRSRFFQNSLEPSTP